MRCARAYAEDDIHGLLAQPGRTDDLDRLGTGEPAHASRLKAAANDFGRCPTKCRAIQ